MLWRHPSIFFQGSGSPGEALLLGSHRCCLRGANQPTGKILVKIVKDFGGKPQATVLGHNFKTSVMNAALANGAMAHALDFDDKHIDSGHPSTPLIPAVLSVAEWKGLSGKSALEACILGFEVETRVGMGTRAFVTRSCVNRALCCQEN